MKKVVSTFLCMLVVVMQVIALPRSEYPRPQFKRSEWINLNGDWTYTFDFNRSGSQKGYMNKEKFDQTILVPYCPESKLSTVGYTDFIEQMWYQRKIEIPSNWQGRKIFLNFGAVDYVSEIYIDGKLAGRHYGGTSSFSIDLTRYVQAGKTHNLVLNVVDEIRDGKQTGGKQSVGLYSAGCNYTRTTGIWQTVWMEAVAPQGLKNVQTITDIDQKQIVVKPTFYGESMSTFRILVKDEGKIVAKQDVKASNNSVAILPMKKIKLWSPESPFLYDVVYQVLDKEGKVIDEVNSYVGMRKIHIEGNRFYLNNEPYYQRLVLDQGFYPEGIWTAPTDEDLKNDIILSKEAGFNGARLHQKVFEERFHYWADKLGYLTWGESSSWGMDITDELAMRNFITEWSEIIVRDRNHPSIVTWTPTNETWGSDDRVYPRMIRDIYNITKAIDPTRPVNDASGDDHVITDVWTVHNYEADGAKLRDLLDIHEGKELYRNDSKAKFAVYEGQPYMIDEFGGIKWIPEKERKNIDAGWGYGNAPKTEEEFYSRLDSQVEAILSLDHVWGFCYTQLTDVEQEQNGIYLYDRKLKFDMNRIKAIFSKPLPKK